MTRRWIRTVRFILAAVLLTSAAVGQRTALDRYVAAPDAAYRFDLVKTIEGDGVSAFVLDLTSLSWRSKREVDRPEWHHWLTIYLPQHVTTATGMLFIGAGDNADAPPSRLDPWLSETALETHSVVAELRMVPNQPLKFADEPEPLREDSLLGYSFAKFLNGGDDTWPALLPMTKSAVRALDTVTTFCGSERGGKTRVDKFFVTGGSKRGWTAWLLAAVDKRVIGIAPQVADFLNLSRSMEHHWQAYGFWAPAMEPFVRAGIVDQIGSKRFDELAAAIDPYRYAERLTMPKFIVNSTGDQFFLPDAWQFSFPDLKGEKHLRYLPNTDHSRQRSDYRQSITAFYDAIAHDRPRPNVTWSIDDKGIRAKADREPSEVLLWQATDAEARDFRIMKIGAVYTSTPVHKDSNGDYVAEVAKPEKGWTDYFLEFTFPSGGKYPLKITTGTKVVPDTLPFPARKKADAAAHK